MRGGRPDNAQMVQNRDSVVAFQEGHTINVH